MRFRFIRVAPGRRSHRCDGHTHCLSNRNLLLRASFGPLTARRARTYSSPMDHDINQLEERVEVLIGRFGALHDENILLRNRVAALEGENRVLGEKVSAARDKVRGLLERLPQE